MRVFIKSLTVILFLNISLFAENISSFDIKDITLYSSYDSILKKLPCSPRIDTKKTDSGKVAEYHLQCTDNNHNEYIVFMNRYKKVMAIYRTKYFNIRPNLKKIHQQLTKKYGKPIINKRVYPTEHQDTEFLDLMCWGNGCKITDNLIYVKQGLTIDYRKRSKSSSNLDELSFKLMNDQIYDENDEWKRKENKRDEQEQLKKEKDALDL